MTRVLVTGKPVVPREFTAWSHRAVDAAHRWLSMRQEASALATASRWLAASGHRVLGWRWMLGVRAVLGDTP